MAYYILSSEVGMCAVCLSMRTVIMSQSDNEQLSTFSIFAILVFTALHGMQTRSSDENSVRLSARPSYAWIMAKR